MHNSLIEAQFFRLVDLTLKMSPTLIVNGFPDKLTLKILSTWYLVKPYINSLLNYRYTTIIWVMGSRIVYLQFFQLARLLDNSWLLFIVFKKSPTILFTFRLGKFGFLLILTACLSAKWCRLKYGFKLVV